jgi:hypothetical protein
MIESPVLQEIIAETKREANQKAIVKFLTARFGKEARSLESELKAIDDDRLESLLELAATCRSLASFRKQLSS